jgi:hypothetical protein
MISVKTAVQVLLFLFFLLLSLALIPRLVTFFSPDYISECQTSIRLAGQFSLLDSTFSLLQFRCPVSFKTLSLSQATSLTGAEKKQFSEQSYVDGEQILFSVSRSLFDEVHDCYKKVSYGSTPLFSRSSPTWRAFASQASTYCVICSHIQLSPELYTKLRTTFPDKSIKLGPHFSGKFFDGYTLYEYVRLQESDDILTFPYSLWQNSVPIAESYTILYTRLTRSYLETADYYNGLNVIVAGSTNGANPLAISYALASVVTEQSYRGVVSSFIKQDSTNPAVSHLRKSDNPELQLVRIIPSSSQLSETTLSVQTPLTPVCDFLANRVDD